MKVSKKKRPNQRTKEAKSKDQEAKNKASKAKAKFKGRQRAKPTRKDSKEDPTATTTQQPTHYEPSGSVPGPQLFDPKRQEGSGDRAGDSGRASGG